MATSLTAIEALKRLREGNLRFANNSNTFEGRLSHQQRADLLAGQEPFAIILGCSDSRVPAEIIFDQGLGDLFVIRVAGNIVAPSQVGSVEFAVSRYHTRLVVVLGHSHCGAVSATIETLLDDEDTESNNIASIVNRVKPSVQSLLDTELRHDRSALHRAAVRANVRASADHLRHGSSIIESLIQKEDLLVVGAEYSLETGLVDFFDGLSGEDL
ncbi:carbonic anhydrase [Imhoffiella purpurea]|nr:carbonic anhydrase [Imhoffiella purpurea]